MEETGLSRTVRATRQAIAWRLARLRVRAAVGFHRLANRPLGDLHRFQPRASPLPRGEYSQNGEDGIIQAIFGMIGETNRYYVEFGVEDGFQCNTRYLRKHRGWTGLLMDSDHDDPSINLHRQFITADNVEALLDGYGVPERFDLLSIDIDGNDFWVWKAIERHVPRVVVIEYNACFPWSESKTIPYCPDFRWDRTDYYGATLQALVHLAAEKGYTLVATDNCGVNAFFVQEQLANSVFRVRAPEQLYHPAAFKGRPGKKHRPDPHGRPWVAIPPVRPEARALRSDEGTVARSLPPR
jgi:hypothetical protein